jgi:hypothetical protein
MTRLELQNGRYLNNYKGKNRYRHDSRCIAGLKISGNTRACNSTDVIQQNIRRAGSIMFIPIKIMETFYATEDKY